MSVTLYSYFILILVSYKWNNFYLEFFTYFEKIYSLGGINGFKITWFKY